MSKEPTKSNTKLVIIVVAIIVILLIGVGGVVGVMYLINHQSNPTPTPTPTPQETQAQDEQEVRDVVGRFLESMNMNTGFNRSEFLTTTTSEYQNTGFAKALLGGTELNYGNWDIVSIARVSDTKYECRVSITTITSEMSGPSRTIMADVEVVKQGASWLVNKME
jgi:hypothetical protein